jgi:hypothetical protein
MNTAVLGLRRTGLSGAVLAVCVSGLMSSPAVLAQAGTGRAGAAYETAAHTAAGAGLAFTPSRPPGRRWASFAYDPAHNEYVLFGGETLSSDFGDTWIHKDGEWTEEDPAHSPSAREGAAMVYDAATNQLLLFGGYNGRYQAGTWVWTGKTWRHLFPAAAPSPRHNADMVYDAASQTVLLFGGYDGHYLGDTWSWDGTTWTQLSPAASPSPRDSESLAYDAATQTAIMYGGFNTAQGRLSDTWAWNGTTWTQLSPAASPGVITTAWMAAYDSDTQQVLLFGGDPGDDRPPVNGTWAWNGTTWTQLSPPKSPPRRAYGSMTYNPSNGQVVLFGGTTNGAESSDPDGTWYWDGTTWHALT